MPRPGNGMRLPVSATSYSLHPHLHVDTRVVPELPLDGQGRGIPVQNLTSHRVPQQLQLFL